MPSASTASPAKRLDRHPARQAGAADPDMLGEQLDVLFDGALAAGAKRADVQAARAAEAAAIMLIGMR